MSDEIDAEVLRLMVLATRYDDERRAATIRAERERRHRKWALKAASTNLRAARLFGESEHENWIRAEAAEARAQAEQQRRETAEARVNELKELLNAALPWVQSSIDFAGDPPDLVRKAIGAALSPHAPQEVSRE